MRIVSRYIRRGWFKSRYLKFKEYAFCVILNNCIELEMLLIQNKLYSDKQFVKQNFCNFWAQFRRLPVKFTAIKLIEFKENVHLVLSKKKGGGLKNQLFLRCKAMHCISNYKGFFATYFPESYVIDVKL